LSEQKIVLYRLLAFFVDWLVIACWGGFLYVSVMSYTSGEIPSISSLWESQMVGFLFMTLPTILYFSFSESSKFQATIGKRVIGLSVVPQHEGSPMFSKVLLRNIVKFLPWEFGHLTANLAIYSSTAIPFWIYIAMSLSIAIPVWWLASIFFRGYAPYESISKTCVRLRAST